MRPSPQQPPKSHLAALPLIRETMLGILARPGRAALTGIGMALSVAAVIATIGVSSSAGAQIVARFDDLRATLITISSRGDPSGSDTFAASIPFEADRVLSRINGVVAAGTFSTVSDATVTVYATRFRDPLRRHLAAVDLFAVSPGYFEARGLSVAEGRVFDSGNSARADRIALLGHATARRLGIWNVSALPEVTVAGETLLVVGILQENPEDTRLIDALIVPNGTAQEVFGLRSPHEVAVRTQLGAAQLVALQAPLALAPQAPDRLAVQVPREPTGVRQGVISDLDIMILALSILTLLIAGIGIANMTLVAVSERTTEIGLRRAVGAKRTHILVQFLLEAAVVGVFGALVGAGAGTVVVSLVADSRGWTAVLDQRLVIAAPLAGGAIGLVAGVYPAWRASTVQPSHAIRGIR